MLSVFNLSDENDIIMLSVVMLNVVEPRVGLSICDFEILWYRFQFRFHFHSFPPKTGVPIMAGLLRQGWQGCLLRQVAGVPLTAGLPLMAGLFRQV